MQYLLAPGTVPLDQADTTPPTGTPGFATNGNPLAGISATRNFAYNMNMLISELARLVTGAGLDLDTNDWTQVFQAVQALIKIEAMRAQTAEKANADALSAETQRATTIESNLQTAKADKSWVQNNYISGLPGAAGNTGIAGLYLINYNGTGDSDDDYVQVVPAGGEPPVGVPTLQRMITYANGKLASGATGSVTLPNGLTFKWGTYQTPASGAAVVNFNTPFANACFAVLPGEANAGGAWTSTVATMHGASNASAGGFTVQTRSVSGSGVAPAACGGTYLAVGA